ncbi:myo-inositol-1(or 4)-monophosphatase [Catalinimonas alkaloidigena]|uniref:inositol monophosphatase family protein n=1 Tax=Catalinimonas alkaloidigena TaxID=1075417 RepID=UPI0024057895|nr:inositol monophosphatase family protein [Catalinimonas alkaloidigena]MDF9800366.1 myo-inositol-1(or 4)-monophosphatase [Catalinimonas alkaloidigena]
MDLYVTLKETLKVVKETGNFIHTEAQKFNLSSIEYKGKNDLVSYVDKEAEKLLVAGLESIVPAAGFITEEGTAEKGRAEQYNWVIDPVDGTTNYVHGIPLYSISVALMEGDEVVLGAIYEPNRDEMFYSIKGDKAYLNSKEISVSPVQKLEESLIATGFPYSKLQNVPAYIKIVEELMQKTHGLRRMGSAAIDLAYVACGRFEGFFEYNLKPWDVAAGGFLVQQAGGKVSTFRSGSDFIFGKELVAGCAIHSSFAEVVNRHWYPAD